MLKEAKKRGNLQEMVEIVNAVGSILNYQGRKADDGANLTSEDQKGVDARKEVRLIQQFFRSY